MIVFDTSTLVGVVIRPAGNPNLAFRRALATEGVAVSRALFDELVDVLHRKRLERFVVPDQRREFLGALTALAVRFEPAVPVRDCRDPKDDKVLELALACAARAIVASDADLLVLHPWRCVPILSPSDYLLTPA